MFRPIPTGLQSSSASLFDPIESGIGAAIITRVFADATRPLTGLLYGGVSGGINYALVRLRDRTQVYSQSPVKKSCDDLFIKTVSWCASAFIMNKSCKLLSKPILNINPLLAFGTAVSTELIKDWISD